MRQVSSTTLHRAAGRLEVDPEQISQEWFLEVAVNVRMIDDPQQFIHGQDRLTHRLDETILSLHITILTQFVCFFKE